MLSAFCMNNVTEDCEKPIILVHQTQFGSLRLHLDLSSGFQAFWLKNFGHSWLFFFSSCTFLIKVVLLNMLKLFGSGSAFILCVFRVCLMRFSSRIHK